MKTADIQATQLEYTARHLDMIERTTGKCTHGHYQQKKDGYYCLRCGKRWDSSEEATAEYNELIS